MHYTSNTLLLSAPGKGDAGRNEDKLFIEFVTCVISCI